MGNTENEITIRLRDRNGIEWEHDEADKFATVSEGHDTAMRLPDIERIHGPLTLVETLPVDVTGFTLRDVTAWAERAVEGTALSAIGRALSMDEWKPEPKDAGTLRSAKVEATDILTRVFAPKDGCPVTLPIGQFLARSVAIEVWREDGTTHSTLSIQFTDGSGKERTAIASLARFDNAVDREFITETIDALGERLAVVR